MKLSRRHFLASVPVTLAAQPPQPAIDRRQLVQRHNPTLSAIEPRSPLSVGNGEFAFTADPTGLQTFPKLYDGQMPLCTQSQWGWHTIPNPSGQGASNLKLAGFDTYGRRVAIPPAPKARRSFSTGSAKTRTASTWAESVL